MYFSNLINKLDDASENYSDVIRHCQKVIELQIINEQIAINRTKWEDWISDMAFRQLKYFEWKFGVFGLLEWCSPLFHVYGIPIQIHISHIKLN